MQLWMAGWLAFREFANAIHIEISCEKIVTFFLELRASCCYQESLIAMQGCTL